MKNNQENINSFKKWDSHTFRWAFVCFLLIGSVNGLFTYLFDVLLFENKIGYGFFYFVLIFFGIILYYFYVRFQRNWFGIFAFGLMGFIGIGIELWLEYYTNPVLKSPWAAVGWGLIYCGYGLIADFSMCLKKIIQKEQTVILLSAGIFGLGSILLSIIPLQFFYVPNPDEDAKSFLTYGVFLIPYAVLQTIMGAYIGMKLAQQKDFITKSK
ncbi:hypothetical protein DSAG12_01973 [Promethearchaeum syntrophicum]|uniref:Uncharacterized protein n=1 Tax=Promethearchaeum syntrophicum TaxID=2594042 RepID=A0A5B9DAJ7_9ARCH